MALAAIESAVAWLVADARTTVHAWVPAGQLAVVDVVGVVVVGVVVVGVEVVGVEVVGVEVVGVEVVGVVVVVPEVTVSKPDPVPVEPVPVDVPVVPVGEVVPAGVDPDVVAAVLLSRDTATARAPVPIASNTSAKAMIRAPLPVASRGALAVGAPHCRQ